MADFTNWGDVVGYEDEDDRPLTEEQYRRLHGDKLRERVQLLRSRGESAREELELAERVAKQRGIRVDN